MSELFKPGAMCSWKRQHIISLITFFFLPFCHFHQNVGYTYCFFFLFLLPFLSTLMLLLLMTTTTTMKERTSKHTICRQQTSFKYSLIHIRRASYKKHTQCGSTFICTWWTHFIHRDHGDEEKQYCKRARGK